jgi:hypothetical protein
MSTWISNAARSLALLALLGACVPVAETGGSAAPTRMAVSVGGAALTIAGPRGYCIVPRDSRSSDDGAFVLLGSCASIAARAGASALSDPAILTASVSTGGAGIEAGFPRMAEFFRSEAGRRALSRSGKAESVEVLHASSRNGVFFLQVRDRSTAGDAGVGTDYWRAIMAVRGQIVTLTVLALKDQPLEAAKKRAVLEAFIARIRAENPGAVAPGTAIAAN